MIKKRVLKKGKKAKTKKRPAPKKRSAAKKKAKVIKPAPRKRSTSKPIGVVTHYYTHIKVAIVRFKEKIRQGTKLYYKGATTDFTDAAASMQYDHKTVATAPKGKQIGIKVKKRVREGDLVYRSE